MLRKSVVLVVGVLLTSLSLSAAGPANAVPDGWLGEASIDPLRGQEAPTAARAGDLDCRVGVVGATTDQHLVYYTVVNGEVESARVSRRELGFNASAFGWYQSKPKKNRFDLTAVTANGKPRLVEVTMPAESDDIKVRSSRLDQRDFSPRLFADGYSFTAYAVENGKLVRYLLTRYPNGKLRYAQAVTVGRGFKDFTSLQTGYFAKKDGAWEEYLYATTEDGALKRIVVPFDRPKSERVRTLKKSGYDGVTELSFGLCNSKPTFTVLVAVDPVAGTATWTTVKKVTTQPRTKLRGEVTGDEIAWDLTAVF